jgi:OOP family OmpA-OmpF porin
MRRFGMRPFANAAIVMLQFAVVAGLHAQDASGSSDHPQIARFRGSSILVQTRDNFNSFTLPLGPAERGEKKFKKEQVLEGKVRRTLYSAPAGVSPLQVFRSYEQALKGAGFATLYSCSGKACSVEASMQNTLGYGGLYLMPLGGRSLDDDATYLLTAMKANTYAMVMASSSWGHPENVFYVVNVVDTKPMESGMVTVRAEEMRNDITSVGHTPIYGVYFDTGKWDIKPASAATLSEISKLLGSNPALKLHVVGHTDNVGGYASNMTLSKQRATAVVNALVGQYHIAASRLDAAGIGSLSPVATNRTDDGRAKNRRVELVEQ